MLVVTSSAMAQLCDIKEDVHTDDVVSPHYSTGHLTSSRTTKRLGTEVVNRSSSGHQSNFHSPHRRHVEPLKHHSAHGCPRLGLQPRGVLVSRLVEPLSLGSRCMTLWGPYQRTDPARSVPYPCWYGRPRQHGSFRARSLAVFLLFCSVLFLFLCK